MSNIAGFEAYSSGEDLFVVDEELGRLAEGLAEPLDSLEVVGAVVENSRAFYRNF